MSERINLTLDDGTKDKLIALAGSDRRMGEYISAIVEQISTGHELRKPDNVVSLLERIEARLILLEQRIERMEWGR